MPRRVLLDHLIDAHDVARIIGLTHRNTVSQYQRGYPEMPRSTVADEYLKVSEQVEALHDAAKELPAEAEGQEMRRLGAEMHRRTLGNGYCAHPVGIDCNFESICESCVYFQTTIEFRPTLQRQRDDAAENARSAA